MKEEEARSELKASWPNPKKIRCRDCLFRDKTKVTVNGKSLEVGVTKSFCAAYPEPPESNGKPHEVLFQNANCEYYANEKKAVE